MLLRIPRFQSVECLFLFSFLCGSLFLLKLLIQSRLTKSLEMPFGSSTKSHKVQEGALMWLIQWYTMIKWYKMTYKMLHKSLCWQLQLDETPPAVLGTSFPEPLPGPVACRFMSLHFASFRFMIHQKFVRSSWEVHHISSPALISFQFVPYPVLKLCFLFHPCLYKWESSHPQG